MTTKITPSVLENTAVVAATHGDGATIPVIVVDPQGRITGVTNTTIGIATSQVTSGTIADARLIDSGAVAGSYGSASIVPMVKVDAKGRATQVANITIAIASSAVSGLATSATTDTTSATNISSGTLAAARLADSGVSATTYGTASSVSQVVVDAKGRITGASNVAIQIATSQITSYPTFAASATTDTTNAGNISSGTLPTARLGDSGVVAGSYGTAAVHPTITVDAKGRVTAVTATNIAIAAGAVSGLATVATSGAYTDLSGRPTIPAAQVNSDWNATTGVSVISNKPSLATVATTGSYSDLSNKPTIPTNISQLTNNSGYLTVGVGQGQTWQTFSRTANPANDKNEGVTYTNTTGKPIQVSIYVRGGSLLLFYVNSVPIATWNFTYWVTVSAIIPAGATYGLFDINNGPDITNNSGAIQWNELR